MPFFKNKKSTKAAQKNTAGRKGFMSNVEVANRDFPIGNSNLYYHNSTIAGVGVYNKSTIAKGHKITEYKGELIVPKKEWRKSEIEKKLKEEVRSKEHYYTHVQHISSTYFFKLKGSAGVVDATKVGNEGRFINHSCDPNCVAIQLTGQKKIVQNPKKKYHQTLSWQFSMV